MLNKTLFFIFEQKVLEGKAKGSNQNDVPIHVIDAEILSENFELLAALQ